MIDVARYKELQFEDRGRGETVDCWGLVQLVYRQEFGIELPSYTEGYRTTQDLDEINALIRAAQHELPWAKIPIEQATPGDLLLMRIEGRATHVGIVVAPPRFLHAIKGAGVVVERWDSIIWKRRVLGCYRLKERSIA